MIEIMDVIGSDLRSDIAVKKYICVVAHLKCILVK